MFLQEAVVFDPLRRTHAGSYSCEAKNFLGNSQAINVDIDVKCKSYIYFLSLFLSPLDSHTIQCKYSQIMRDHIFFPIVSGPESKESRIQTWSRIRIRLWLGIEKAALRTPLVLSSFSSSYLYFPRILAFQNCTPHSNTYTFIQKCCPPNNFIVVQELWVI